MFGISCQSVVSRQASDDECEYFDLNAKVADADLASRADETISLGRRG